jgi:hypothetical protein
VQRRSVHGTSRRARLPAIATGLAVTLTLPLAAPSARPAMAATSRACASVIVSVDWDHDRAAKVSGVVVRVRYPGSLDVPLDEKRPGSAQDRVQLLTSASGGLFDAVPRDSDGDGRKDVLSVGLITQGISSGTFARIGFDCTSDIVRAKASDFSCVADIADEAGSVPGSCSVAVAAD